MENSICPYSFFTANISTSTRVNIDIEIISTSASIFTNKSSSISLERYGLEDKKYFSSYFFDGSFEFVGFNPEFTSDVDVSGFSSHGETDNKGTFDQFVGVTSQDFSILASSWFGLIGINGKIRGSI